MAFRKVQKKDEQKVLVVPDELITVAEYARRKKVWQDIYAKARQSKSYERFLKMRAAVKAGDMATVKKIRAVITEERINGSVIPEPPFPDPEVESVYGRVGIKEVWDEKIEKAKSEGVTIKIA
jgi:hypothetical protein